MQMVFDYLPISFLTIIGLGLPWMPVFLVPALANA